MATKMRARFPVLLLLAIVFLASVSVSFGALAYWQTENPCPGKCMQSCANENEEYRQKACDARCKMIQGGGGGGRCRQQGEEQREQHPAQGRQRQGGEEQEEEEEEQSWRFRGERPREQQEQQQQKHEQERPRWEREQEGQRGTRGKGQGRGQWGQEDEDEEDEEEEGNERQPWGQRREEQERRRSEQQREERPWRGRGREQQEEEREEEEEEEWRGPRRRQDPEERERVREREERRRREQEREQSQERQREERHRRREKEEQQQEREEGQGSRSPSRASRNNPFYFPSRRFRTRYGNQHGRIRVLQRFDQRSRQFQNLQNYRVVEIEARPNTLVLPKHADADNILVVQQGQATVTLVSPNNRQTYNLESGDALRIPSGTISYILNRHDNQNLRVAKLSMPVNKPGQFEDFFPASSQDQPSYFRGFSRSTLEAAFNAQFEEIQRILLEENQGQEEQPQSQPQRHQSQEEGVIVKVSREQIQELTRHAKSSPRRGSASESGPFNLRNRNPVYSNRFGRHFEVTPDSNPQLQDLDIFLSCVEINEGALMLPHYNSKAIVVLVVNQGRGSIELVGVREQQQQEEEEEEEEEEGSRQVRRYTARLSQGDIVVIPAAYPVAIKASSDLHLLGFGINAENNQRYFLAGESDNVINQIHRQVKELTFPGSGQEVERLIRNQRESHFVSAKPRQGDGGRQGRRGPLSSILSAFY